MPPNGPHNYCCGGGSGYAIMSRNNIPDWRHKVAGRKKLTQILAAFEGCAGPETPKYVCAPCSNCKGQIRDIFERYDLKAKEGLIYSGLVELIVNAMVDVKPGGRVARSGRRARSARLLPRATLTFSSRSAHRH